MRVFFWDFNDLNDIEREWIMFVINILAVFFTSYCLVKTAKHHGKILFELLPLSINTAATIMLLFLKLFEKGYQFGLVGYAIEIFTYFLFCYTFALLYARIINKQSTNLKRACNGVLAVLAVGTIVTIALILASVIGRDCDNNLLEISVGGFATELLSYIPTAYFGIQILKNMGKKDKQEKAERSAQMEIVFESISDRYIKQRKKQIKIVLVAFTVSLVLRALALGFNIDWQSYFTCIECDGVYILTSDKFWGQFLLVLIEVNQLIPHLIIPVAFFVIPVGNLRKSHKVDLQETLIEEDDDLSEASERAQRIISSSILSKARSSPQREEYDDN